MIQPCSFSRQTTAWPLQYTVLSILWGPASLSITLLQILFEAQPESESFSDPQISAPDLGARNGLHAVLLETLSAKMGPHLLDQPTESLFNTFIQTV